MIMMPYGGPGHHPSSHPRQTSGTPQATTHMDSAPIRKTGETRLVHFAGRGLSARAWVRTVRSRASRCRRPAPLGRGRRTVRYARYRLRYPRSGPATPTTPATLFTGAGANAAAAASGAGAMASSSDHHVTARGSALLSAEMVISCAAPARSSAPRRHAQLGGAGTGGGLAGVDVRGSEEVSTGAFCMLMARSWRTNPIMANIAPTRLPGSPDLKHRPDRPRRNSPAANSPSCCQGGRGQPTPGDASETGVEVAARDERPWTACHCYRSDGAARPPRPRDSA
jgi:hypothetical protein